MDATGIHDRIRAAVIDLREDFTRLSLEIHAHPETAFEERHASQVLRQWLAGRGFSVEAPIARLDTAFRAVRGSGAPVVWRSLPSTTRCQALGTPVVTT